VPADTTTLKPTRHVSRAAVSSLAVALIVSAAALSGCSASSGDDSRPAPQTVVEQYLDAIADGDASTATALDAAAVATENDTTGKDTPPDLTTLRTDAVLTGADSRITDPVADDGDEAEPGADADTRRVGFSFALDGKRHTSSLVVHWDDKADTWVLQQSLTVALSVTASRSKAETELASFLLRGLTEPIDPDPRTGPLTYLVYPGVYTVSAGFDTALLDGSADAVTVTALPTADADVDFRVSTLPPQG